MLKKTLATISAVALLIGAISFTPVRAYENTSSFKENTNLLKDGDFESLTEVTKYGAWQPEHADLSEVQIDNGNAHSGKNCLKIVPGTNMYDFMKQPGLKVEKNTYYAYEAYVKAEGSVEMAIIGVWDGPKNVEIIYKPTNEYKKIVHYFYSGDDDTITPFINLRAASGTALYVDDLKLYKLELKDIEGDNLLKGASFEEADANAWTIPEKLSGFDKDANFGFDTKAGNAWVRLNKADAADNYYEVYQDVDVEKNTDYRFSFYARLFGAHEKGEVKGVVKTADGAEIQSATFDTKNFVNPYGAYRLVTVSFNSGENTKVRLAMGVNRLDSAVDVGAQFDSASLNKLKAAPAAAVATAEKANSSTTNPSTGDSSSFAYVLAGIISLFAAIGFKATKKAAIDK